MPPPCVCLFQPRLLFPYDDYRGPLASVAILCLGVCIEVLCLFSCFLWGVVCIHRGASPLHWALLPLPLLSFDFLVFFFGLLRFLRSYSWLLPSEKRLRVILLVGVFSRFLLSFLFSLYVLNAIPLVALLAVSFVSYGSSTLLNINRNDAYTWARLQCWDLVVLLQLGTLCLPAASYSLFPSLSLRIFASPACVWPLWVVAGAYLCCCLLLGLLLLRDTALQQNTVTRVIVHLSEMHAVAFLLSVVAFSQWLSMPSNPRFVVFVSSAVVSFFLLLLFAAFVVVCFIARHSQALTEDIEQGGGGRGAPFGLHASSTASAAMGPPLMCDMKLTLERVSEHFYRIGGPPEGPPAERVPTAGPIAERLPASKGPPAELGSSREEGPLTEESPREGGPIEQAMMKSKEEQQPEAGGSPTAAAAAAAADGTAAVEKQEEEAELCIICCNKVRLDLPAWVVW